MTSLVSVRQLKPTRHGTVTVWFHVLYWLYVIAEFDLIIEHLPHWGAELKRKESEGMKLVMEIKLTLGPDSCLTVSWTELLMTQMFNLQAMFHFSMYVSKNTTN